MKNRTKISLLLLALTLSMTVSANTEASESMFSKKAIHSFVQQNIDSTLDALLDEFKIKDTQIAPITPIAPIISKIETKEKTVGKNLKKQTKEIEIIQVG